MQHTKYCDWKEFHKNHWICQYCGYNTWGRVPPKYDCMEEDSQRDLSDFINDRHKDKK